MVPKLVWLRNHRPQDFERIRTVFSAHDYVVFRLTGERCVDYDTSSILGGIFDDQSKDWAANVCQRLDLDPDLFPPTRPATALVGGVTARAASETGLAQGIPVIAGTGDTLATIVGCGVIDPGDGMVAFGTTGLMTLTKRRLADSADGPHFDNGSGTAPVTWVANVLSAGRLVRWYYDMFGGKDSEFADRAGADPYALMDIEAGRISPGAEGLLVLPHWLGRRTPTPDPDLRGAMIGFTPAHTPAHIYRAILESFAYNQRQTYVDVRPLIRRLVATAGGARSKLWRQIVADVLGTSLEYYPVASGALGIAFLAGHATGLIPKFEDIKHVWLTSPEMTLPDPRSASAYERYYDIYCDFERQMTAPFARLARLAAGESNR